MSKAHPLHHLQGILREFKDRVLEGEYDDRLLKDAAQNVFAFFNELPMSRTEAAAFLGVSLTTFDKYRKEGRFPEHYPGGQRKKWVRARFFRSEITLNLTLSLPGFRDIDGGNPCR